jgi:hypothetical protein
MHEKNNRRQITPLKLEIISKLSPQIEIDINKVIDIEPTSSEIFRKAKMDTPKFQAFFNIPNKDLRTQVHPR